MLFSNTSIHTAIIVKPTNKWPSLPQLHLTVRDFFLRRTMFRRLVYVIVANEMNGKNVWEQFLYWTDDYGIVEGGHAEGLWISVSRLNEITGILKLINNRFPTRHSSRFAYTSEHNSISVKRAENKLKINQFFPYLNRTDVQTNEKWWRNVSHLHIHIHPKLHLT